MSSLAEIEWIEIPAGDFLYGLSDLQLETIRERLWQDYGINGLDSDQRHILKSLIAKFQFRGRELKTGRSFILNNLTSEERHLFKELNDKPEGSYLWAESKLEMITAQGV
ncbi:MAG TPA: hypothetical protein VHO69_00995, partial [Phototrophicaceae bacterium]|nr:hypothetical protein [Phototrophicaceae bacterium]